MANAQRGLQPHSLIMAGTVVVVTGASSGIGAASARALAGAGAKVVLAVRDTAKGERIAATMTGDTEVRLLDLEDLASVRAFAAAWTGPIDILINNAGIMLVPEARTADGFERQIGTNHLGHFVLTNLLLPHITGRIVTVASNAHARGQLDLDDLNWRTRPYDTSQAYSDSKLANLLFTFELQRRLGAGGSSVRAMAVHPGHGPDEPVRSPPRAGVDHRPHRAVRDAGSRPAVPGPRCSQRHRTSLVGPSCSPAASDTYEAPRASRPRHLRPTTPPSRLAFGLSRSVSQARMLRVERSRAARRRRVPSSTPGRRPRRRGPSSTSATNPLEVATKLPNTASRKERPGACSGKCLHPCSDRAAYNDEDDLNSRSRTTGRRGRELLGYRRDPTPFKGPRVTRRWFRSGRCWFDPAGRAPRRHRPDDDRTDLHRRDQPVDVLGPDVTSRWR